MIEAIVENVDIKKGVFEQLEDIVKPGCILATNTSSLSVSGIASACKNASRVLGIHFFNPAPLMKLVEIIPALQSDSKIVEQATELIKNWGKTTVLAKDTPGFIVNRVARPFYGEALQIYEEGIADFATIDWAMKEIGGFRMGPFALMDYIGNDVNFAVTSSVFASLFLRPALPPLSNPTPTFRSRLSRTKKRTRILRLFRGNRTSSCKGGYSARPTNR